MPATSVDTEKLLEPLHRLTVTSVDLSVALGGPHREAVAKRYRVLEGPCYEFVAALREAELIDVLAEHAQLNAASTLPFPYRIPQLRKMTRPTKTWSPGVQQQTDDATANARLLFWFAVAHEPEKFGADLLFWQQLLGSLPLYNPHRKTNIATELSEDDSETDEVVRPLGRIQEGVVQAAKALVHAAQQRMGTARTNKAEPSGATRVDGVGDTVGFPTLTSIARHLGVSYSTVRRWRNDGHLRVSKVERGWHCFQSNLDRLRRAK